MAAIQQRKVQEGLQFMREAEKSMKTSWLKWKPDLDSAADRYMKAGNSFKAGRSYPEAEDAFKKAAEAYYNNNSFFHSAKALEQAASVLKEMKRISEAVELIERAGMQYRESGSPDTAAMCLIRGGKMCEGMEASKAINMFLSAGDLNVGEDKIREGIEPMVHAVRLLLKTKRYEEAIGVKKKILELYGSIENFAMMYKTVLGLVVVYLHESDYVAADKCYKDSFSIPGFGSSEEAEAAERILQYFDEGDADGLKSCTSQPLFTYLDNEIAKLARSLRVPGDFPENPSKPNKPKNELFDKPKSVEKDYSNKDEDEEEDEDDDDEQLDTELEKTEESAKALTNPDEEDEFAGGLC
ncbi:gamma-soluble NSF attachment protein-like [Actinia tenebrosa]|uniref:Gamma-soluble NSF attachment protein n=1 Tax=Actinia tenebrosa TaxID=6105 RepID=A0A6P8IBZ8_ACTTE|nr:gamma-soluble NSF attachment protein-like [Actinia tenebrosa]